MTYNPDLDHRRTVRLPDYDYTQGGAYYVTLCSHNKQKLFGEVVDEKISLSAAGAAAEHCWLEIPKHFPAAELDVFIVMPTHLHGIIFLQGPSAGANDYSPLRVDGHPHGTSHTIGSIVRGFKIGVTRWFQENRPDIDTVWQRNYYERVIRNEEELRLVREYITNNALRRGESADVP